MFGLGTTEILFICLLALIFFKAEDLPKVARSVGRFMNELKRGSDSFQTQFLEADKKLFQDSDSTGFTDQVMNELEKKLMTKEPPSARPSETAQALPKEQPGGESAPSDGPINTPLNPSQSSRKEES